DVRSPAGVAEMALELADDGRDRKRAELDPAVGIETVDRAEQAEVGDLHEILQRLVRAVVTPGEAAGHRGELLEQLVAGTAIGVVGGGVIDGDRHSAFLLSSGPRSSADSPAIDQR